jgi:hypothetical protein
MGATLRERRDYYTNKNGFLPVEGAMLAAGLAAKQIGTSPLIRGVEDLPATLDVKEGERWAAGTLGSFLPGSSIARNVGAGLDTFERKPETFAERLGSGAGLRGMAPTGAPKTGGLPGLYKQAFDPTNARPGKDAKPDFLKRKIIRDRTIADKMKAHKGKSEAARKVIEGIFRDIYK